MLITSDFIYMFFFSILVRIAPIMRHNIKKKKKKKISIFKRGRITKDILDNCCREKNCKPRLIHSP